MMPLTFRDDRYEWRGGYDTRRTPKGAGFEWDRESKVWWTHSDAVALLLIEHADEEARPRLEAAQHEAERIERASFAQDSEIEIPAPNGLAYYPFQRAGIAYALQRDATLIADEMGLGKTIQALGVVNADSTVQRVLIICPASLRIQWAREAERWLVRAFAIGVVSGGKPTDWPTQVDVVVVNYDVLRNHAGPLRAQPWDLVIYDEAHYLKNPKTQRTKAAFGGQGQRSAQFQTPIPARRRLFLTGTPILNRPVELHPILRAIDPDQWQGWYAYVTRYCAGHKTRYGWDVSGATRLDELQHRLRSTCMVRRRKSDVLPSLPPKQRQVVALPAEGITDSLRSESEAFNQWREQLVQLKAVEKQAGATSDSGAYEQDLATLRKGVREAFHELSRARHRVALAKLPWVIEFLEDAVQAGPVACFAHHRDVIAQITAPFGEACVVMTGDTTLTARQAAVERFQNDDNCLLFVGQIRVAGLGWTLTRSSHVVFAELDWSPAVLTQAEDRCHRIGTMQSVLVQHLIANGSVDVQVAETLLRKQAVMAAALDAAAAPEADVPVVDEKDECEEAAECVDI